MPELRRDPIIGRWVIIATERGKRPVDFSSPEPTKERGFCPFCAGNEDKTPAEVLAYRPAETAPNSEGWRIRVVPNKFPALMVEGDLGRVGEGMYDMMSGIGAHEVIIETPDHEASWSTMSQANLEEVLWAFKERIEDLKQDPRFKYILTFKNHGDAAGASLEHPHTQMIALPIIPKRVAEEMEGSRAHFANKERCIFCDIIHQEQMSKSRIITENKNFIAFTPFASRFPFETWVLPKMHISHYEDSEKVGFDYLASLLRDTMRRLDTVLSDPPYNLIIHTSPVTAFNLEYYHWHIEIIPKLTKVAGFEWGTGFYINPTPPEEAAEYLREAND
ncbi:galactose-1-phosphate uridylyltransferase [Nitrospinae bacterium AH_259_B05_G02_I21]|nr:galactose-1-phosphate uridylyltransferase [Nitrospinae bacterium AH_259_B05_G02_I21]